MQEQRPWMLVVVVCLPRPGYAGGAAPRRPRARSVRLRFGCPSLNSPPAEARQEGVRESSEVMHCDHSSRSRQGTLVPATRRTFGARAPIPRFVLGSAGEGSPGARRSWRQGGLLSRSASPHPYGMPGRSRARPGSRPCPAGITPSLHVCLPGAGPCETRATLDIYRGLHSLRCSRGPGGGDPPRPSGCARSGVHAGRTGV